MKFICGLLITLFTISLYAQCPHRTLDICPVQSYYGEDPNLYPDVGAYLNPGVGDIFYEVQINQHPMATTPPSNITISISGFTNPVFVGLLGVPCDLGSLIDSWVYYSGGCSQPYDEYEFSIPGSGIYYFVVEGDYSETFDIHFSGNTGTANCPNCPQGMLAFDDIIDCSFIPRSSLNPSFEVCVNGNTVLTDAPIMYDLAPATNQVCIKTAFQNLSGGESLNYVEWFFGPDLVAIPTTTTCFSSTILNPYDILPAQQNGNGGWQVSNFSFPDTYFDWTFNTNSSQGDTDECIYDCHIYEFCFEVQASSNDPFAATIDGLFYSDGFSSAGTKTFGCVIGCGFGGGGGGGNGPLTIGITPVPVDLVSFTAKAAGETSILSWATASELDNSHFEVEHSTDGKTFQPIGRVEGHGTTVEPQVYNSTHNNPIKGGNYYRLKQVDFDKSFEYSSIQTLSFKSRQITAKVYPSPSSHSLNIETEAALSSIEILDIRGNILLQRTYDKANKASINIEHLISATYFARIQIGDEVSLIKFVKN